MESTSRNLGKDGRKEDIAVLYAIEGLELKGETLVSKRCRRNREPGRTLILSTGRSRARGSASCGELILQNLHGSNISIPKYITTFDEKYVIRCLELIRNCALRAAAWNFSSKVDILSDHTRNLANISNSSTYMAIECPLGGGTEVIMNSTGDWNIGTVSGSRAMINILNSPLLQQYGSLDGNANNGKTDLLGEPFYSEFMDTLREPTSTLSHKLQNVKVLDHKYVSAPLHTRNASISSSNLSISDQSSSSAYGTSFQGMLQYTWKDEVPHFVFTVDDKREVYVANLSKIESSDDKDSDYFYTFLSRKNCKKDCGIPELELQIVAKMRVSTSVTFSSNNSEERETQFVLFVSNDNCTGEMEISNHAHKKNKRLKRKVVNVFRSGHSHKQRSSSILGGSSATFKDTPSDPSEEVHNNFLDQGDICAENKYAPNFELAAIIVKDIYTHRKEAELGGWGLKFLKTPENNSSLDTIIPSECSRNTGECSTSMDILVPAGFHGGPRTRVGGPSSLIERWISGGHCDCGGWDIGCPLTVLNTKSSSTDYPSPADNLEGCKSIDLFLQGSKQNVPIMKMVNIHKDLYYIHFQSTLSTLQSFAIAAAIIHSHCPVFRSRLYRS